jgi:hemolysin III
MHWKAKDPASCYSHLLGVALSIAALGWSVLSVVWGMAVLGLVLKLFFRHLPRWTSTALYVGMGWVVVLAIVPLGQSLPVSALTWLATGGVLYTLGAVIYAVKWPNPVPPVFGFHEVFHVFVLAGSITHFVFMVRYVLPGA